MPYKFQTDKKKIPEDLDRRVKIKKEDHPYIKHRHKEGEAIRSIARSYGVDKRLIQFILFPERQKLNLELRKQRGGSKQYYEKNKWRETMREHRRYKQSIKDKLLGK